MTFTLKTIKTSIAFSFAILLAPLLAPTSLMAEDTESLDLPVELTSENYDQWRDHILPDESEFEWQKIPWLTSFKDGILAGDRDDKPVLLWTMNGHPLGCT